MFSPSFVHFLPLTLSPKFFLSSFSSTSSSSLSSDSFFFKVILIFILFYFYLSSLSLSHHSFHSSNLTHIPRSLSSFNPSPFLSSPQASAAACPPSNNNNSLCPHVRCRLRRRVQQPDVQQPWSYSSPCSWSEHVHHLATRNQIGMASSMIV